MQCVDVRLLIVVGCFFFQAEDGIRDLVRSRGLGDVYKRQVDKRTGIELRKLHEIEFERRDDAEIALAAANRPEPVSYTHLTLPTSDLV